MSSYKHPTDRHFGAIMCSCSDPPPAFGHTIGSETCLRTYPDASAEYQYYTMWMTTGASRDSNSSFQTFSELNSTLGFHMKKTQEQPPANQHKIQGVIIRCSEQHITVQPCPDRVQRILTELHNHTKTETMTPEQARRLACKCSFTTTHLFGRVGRAPLRALYDKSFSTTDKLNTHTHKQNQPLSHSQRSYPIAYQRLYHFHPYQSTQQSCTQTPSFPMATNNTGTATSKNTKRYQISTSITPMAGPQSFSHQTAHPW